MTSVLGIDLGTSGVKVLACSQDGTVLGTGTAGYSVQSPRPGWAETAPEEWWRATRAAVRDATAVAGEVAAVAIVGQMHGVVLADAAGTALRPAIVWLDRRADEQAAAYRDLPAALREPLGNQPSPGMAGPLLAWLARHEPGTYASARWQLQPKDWLRMRLTGTAATDHTDASGTLLYDQAAGTWATGLTTALGLRGDLLPPIHDPAALAGTLQPGPARQLGLPPGLPVAVGAADTAASLHAAALSPAGDQALLTLGTGGQWVMPAGPGGAAHPGRPDPAGRTNLFRAVDDSYYRLAAAQNVGATLDWVRRTLRTSWDELYAAAARPAGDHPPVFRPYLAGERYQHQAEDGAWTGLTLAHQREDLMRAALAGVATLLRQTLQDLRTAGSDPASVLIAGGGATNAAWRTLLTQTLGLPIHQAATSWLTSRGATLIAASHVT